MIGKELNAFGIMSWSDDASKHSNLVSPKPSISRSKACHYFHQSLSTILIKYVYYFWLPNYFYTLYIIQKTIRLFIFLRFSSSTTTHHRIPYSFPLFIAYWSKPCLEPKLDNKTSNVPRPAGNRLGAPAVRYNRDLRNHNQAERSKVPPNIWLLWIEADNLFWETLHKSVIANK